MTLTLLLPWFPIVLGAGLGGRLLGHTRGLFVGILCALFWVVLVQASMGAALWGDPWTVATIVTGAVAIAAMGAWSGELPVRVGRGSESSARRMEPGGGAMTSREEAGATAGFVECLSAATDQFDDWLESNRDDSDVWGKFDEFIRGVMYGCCRATHVKPYRLLSEEDELSPLREADPFGESGRLSARRGIVGHVVTTGRSYVATDPMQGELVETLAEHGSEEDSIAWCFAVRQGARRLGVVTVGRLDLAPERHRVQLRAVERLVGLFWRALAEAVRSRSAQQVDPVSGLPIRPAFFREAERAIRESYDQGEPVAVGVIAMEGLRELTDTGRWEAVDELVREVCRVLRGKVRIDDRLGRFDESRFVLLLRRVDSELASLIVSQLLSRIGAICSERSRWHSSLTVRCGLAGSGTEHPDLSTLVSRALANGRSARLEDKEVVCDLGGTPADGVPA